MVETQIREAAEEGMGWHALWDYALDLWLDTPGHDEYLLKLIAQKVNHSLVDQVLQVG
jgi:hypothetical protein